MGDLGLRKLGDFGLRGASLFDPFRVNRDNLGRCTRFSHKKGEVGLSGDGDSGNLAERDMKFGCLSFREKSTTGDLMMMGAELRLFFFGVQRANWTGGTEPSSSRVTS